MRAVSIRLSQFAHTMERALPGAPFDTVLPWRRRVVRIGGVAVVARPAAVRVLIAPENSAGQGTAWAHALNEVPGVTATNLMIRSDDDRWNFPAGHVVTSAIAAHEPWQRAQLREAERFTHVIFESGRGFGAETDRMAQQVRRLRDHGVRVMMMWHGSDIRDPVEHMRTERFSPFAHLGEHQVAMLTKRAARNREIVDALGLDEFVSTPDLMKDAPRATWVPIVVDCEAWGTAAKTAARFDQRPIVVHAPSSGPMKGSQMVRDTAHRLHDEGLIEYREANGLAHSRLREFYARADVVLDQFAVGSFGVASVEALAAGRLVIANVSAQIRETAEATGSRLPIVQADPETLESVLRDVVSEPDQYREIAASGREYARAVHDGRLSARTLHRSFTVEDAQTGHGRMDGCPPPSNEGETA